MKILFSSKKFQKSFRIQSKNSIINLPNIEALLGEVEARIKRPGKFSGKLIFSSRNLFEKVALKELFSYFCQRRENFVTQFPEAFNFLLSWDKKKFS